MPRPRQFDSDEVLDAAVDAFWGTGYEATSLPALLDRTGLARQSLYNAFGDKHAIFLAALRRYSDRAVEAFASRLSAPSARAGVRAAFDLVARGSEAEQRRGCLIASTAAELGSADADAAAIVRDGLRRFEALFAAALHRGIASGELPLPTRRVEATARFLVGVLQGLRVTARAVPGSPLIRDTAQVALRVID